MFSPSFLFRLVFTGTLALVYIATPIGGQLIVGAQSMASPTLGQTNRGSQIILKKLSLPTGSTATVYSDGLAIIRGKDGTVEERRVRLQPDPLYPSELDKKRLAFDLTRPKPQRFVPSEVVVVFQTGVAGTDETFAVPSSELLALRKEKDRRALTAATVPAYTNDAATNEELAALGVDRSEHLFQAVSRSTLSTMHSRAQLASPQEQLLDFSNAYRLHISDASVQQAVLALSRLRSVTYASPNWIIDTMDVDRFPLGEKSVEQSRADAETLARHQATNGLPLSEIPSNYAVSSSLQSLLNAPGTNAIAAYDEVERHFHQLPGEGEIITDVSTGDLDDAVAGNTPGDPCAPYVSAYGPTTELIGGQRYINWPSMPLIPTYSADRKANLSGSAEVCGVDPYLGEVGLDFSVIAPLPHQRQRTNEMGLGATDLLGIAPGAKYRLVVPGQDNQQGLTGILDALLGAATQEPRPNVITASLGFGYDVYGMSGRYLESDRLARSLIAGIVHGENIVVCISAGDGTRLYTLAAIGPSGGSTATNLLRPDGTPTTLNDVAFTSVPSEISDSGAIDVGGCNAG